MLERDPEQLKVIIEIPAHSPAIQYEIDKQSGALFVKRFLPTSMHFPCDYGYIPQTASEQNDFLRAIVITPLPVMRHCLMQCRLIGMLAIHDNENIENKIVVVPSDKLCEHYDDVHTIDDLPSQLLEKIAHFFMHYQEIDLKKTHITTTWHDKATASEELLIGTNRFNGCLKERVRA